MGVKWPRRRDRRASWQRETWCDHEHSFFRWNDDDAEMRGKEEIVEFSHLLLIVFCCVRLLERLSFDTIDMLEERRTITLKTFGGGKMIKMESECCFDVKFVVNNEIESWWWWWSKLSFFLYFGKLKTQIAERDLLVGLHRESFAVCRFCFSLLTISILFFWQMTPKHVSPD